MCVGVCINTVGHKFAGADSCGYQGSNTGHRAVGTHLSLLSHFTVLNYVQEKINPESFNHNYEQRHKVGKYLEQIILKYLYSHKLYTFVV